MVSIVILCHNDGRYLRDCLRSVRRHTDGRTPYEIVLVNNASRDGSERFLRDFARAHDVRLIENARNRFFAGGNNQGIRIARGRYVLLLNADTLVGPGWLSRLIACAELSPEFGAVGPCTNGAVGDQVVIDPDYPGPRGFEPFARAWAEKWDGGWREVHRLTAFCLLVKREALRRVGFLDERFGPGGYEDYDYCLRLRQAGFKVILADDVFVHHFGGRGYVGMDYDALRARNREVLAGKWCAYAFEALDRLDSFLAHRASRPRGAPQHVLRAALELEALGLEANGSGHVASPRKSERDSHPTIRPGLRRAARGRRGV